MINVKTLCTNFADNFAHFFYLFCIFFTQPRINTAIFHNSKRSAMAGTSVNDCIEQFFCFSLRYITQFHKFWQNLIWIFQILLYGIELSFSKSYNFPQMFYNIRCTFFLIGIIDTRPVQCLSSRKFVHFCKRGPIRIHSCSSIPWKIFRMQYIFFVLLHFF